jgi:uncharacterized membrane protein
MKKQFVINLVLVLSALSPIVYLLIVWESIPDSFVTKLEFDNTIEKIQGRDSLMTATIVVSISAALIFLLMRNLRKVDPKVKDSTPKSTFNKLGVLLLIFLTCWNYFFILSVQNNAPINVNITFAGVGLLITVVGNYMSNLKPNYVAGIRLPWTLNDPENWRQTHRMASKVWFVGGLVLILISLALPKNLFLPLFTAVMVVLVLVPSVYSFRMHRNKSNR